MKTINILVFMVLAFGIQNAAWSNEYALQRSITILPDGQSFDTLRGDTIITGTMTVNDTDVIQSITACSVNTPPICNSAEIRAKIISTSINDSSVVLRYQNGTIVEYFLLSLDPIMTLINDRGFVQTDQWVLSQLLSASDKQIPETLINPTPIEFTGSEKFDSPIVELLFSLDLISFPEHAKPYKALNE